eukprot:TRINITY_DN44414_c0_g1_i1.p1 TRINITY_DN44414_c0_g1~~TRINITY_DN44414_c0_g1_i1.p1  ORF type:complete len:294 (-),score=54.49 TRINITY_DN44414_c0_g1_i1:39-830(-)
MSVSVVPSYKSAVSVRRQLSALHENVVCRMFYEFIFVGSSAIDVIHRLFDADMNEAMTELAEQDAAPDGLRTSSASRPRRNLYVRLTEDHTELARIGCTPMVSFDDSVPELKDDAAVRTNLFIFIYDTQSEEPDFRPMEVLNMMFAQMQFQYRNLMKRQEKPPALRALVLRNSGLAMTEPEEQALLEFEGKLKEFTSHGPLKKVEWTADLREPDELYELIEEIVQVLGRPCVSNARSATTRWSLIDHGKKDDRNKSSRSCCVL